MKIKGLLVMGLLSLSFLVGCSGNMTSNGDGLIDVEEGEKLEMIADHIIDLDGDGEEDRVKVYNLGTDSVGQLYLKINNQDILLEDNFYPPEDKMYQVDVDYLNFDSQINLVVNLRQYANGVGSNSFVRMFELKDHEIKSVWDYSELEPPSLLSIKDGQTLKLTTDKGLEEDIDLNAIPEKIGEFMQDLDIPENVQHSISSPVTSRLVRQNGAYSIEVVYLVRKPLFITSLIETYKLESTGVTFVKDELILE